MNPQAHRELDPSLLCQTGIELPQGFDHPQPAPTARGNHFRAPGGTKVDQQPIAEILGDVPVERAITLAQVS